MTLLNHWVSSLASFAGQIGNVRECLKAVRAREEALAEMHRHSRSLKSKTDSAGKKLNKMTPRDKDFQQQRDILGNLRDQVRTLDIQIMDEEASLGGWKRIKAKEWMDILFSGLLGCSANGAVVATSCRAIIECVPTDTTQPGLPRAYYSGHSQVELLVAEAERTIRKISSIGEAGVSFVSEAGVSVVSGVGDGTFRGPNNGSGTCNIPRNIPSVPSLPIQPTPTQQIQLYASSTLPNNPPSDPHELDEFGQYNPFSHSQTYTHGQRDLLSPFDESLLASPARSNVFTPSPPPRPLGLTRDSSSPSLPFPPTPTHQWAEKLAATEEQIRLDAEIAKHLQGVEDAGDIYANVPEMYNDDRCVAKRPLFPCRDLDHCSLTAAPQGT